MAVDLNQLRTTLIESQRRNETIPANPARQVVIDREGNVIMGDDALPGAGTTLVPQDVFARGCP